MNDCQYYNHLISCELFVANLAWNLGGRELFWQYVYFNHEYIIMPEYYNGTLGRPDTLPFK